MATSKLILVLVLCLACAYPVASISRWFSTTFNDLKFTLYRYGHCYAGLQPLNSKSFNETEYLIHQIRVFLDQGNYDNEQLANVSALMDNICRPNIDTSYPISVHIDVQKFSNGHPQGKENRCRAIDDSLDSMYYVFKRAALNRSEPLDFSVIQFYPNETDHSIAYNLTDLINTSWIKSETILEHVCGITNATKEYVQARASNSTAQARQQTSSGLMNSMVEYLNRLLDPILGIQKRLYWEGSNRIELLTTRVSSGLGTIRGGIGSGLGRTRQLIFGARTNNSTRFNETSSVQLANTTSGPIYNMTMKIQNAPSTTSALPTSTFNTRLGSSTAAATTTTMAAVSAPTTSLTTTTTSAPSTFF